jgi:hypothetical protein
MRKPTPCTASYAGFARSPCPGRGAAFFMPLRRAGTVLNTARCTAPALQRTAPQELRAALRPGHESFDCRVKPGNDEKPAHICGSQAVNPRKNP